MGMSQSMEVLTSHDSQEWLTPPYYVTLVRNVIGEIDLDPAGNKISQRWIQAGEYREVSGLVIPWYGKVFCNPPYGKTGSQSNQGIWSNFMSKEYEEGRIEEGILLINSTHGYKWYEDIWIKYPVCLLKERIRFWYPWNNEGIEGGQAKRGQTFVYFGKSIDRFVEVFKHQGRVILP